MKKYILHILSSTKRDVPLINLYDSIEDITNVFLFNEEVALKKNDEKNFNLLKEKDNVFFYRKNNIEKKVDNHFDFIFIYTLGVEQIKLSKLYHTKQNTIVWISLGGEIENRSFMDITSKFQPETLKFLNKINFISDKKTNFFYNLFKGFTIYSKFLKQVDYVSPRFSYEMDIISNNKYINAEYVRLPIGDNHSNKNMKVSPINFDADEIYIGSSASPDSNHIDVLYKIADLDLKRNINITLSYKIKCKKYRDYILKLGSSLFKNNFKPQTDFLTKHEYMNTLKKSSIAIFNHEIQEGVSSIELCIEMGMKVFLSENSPTYKHLKEMGYNIYSFQNEFNFETINGIHKKSDNLNKDSIYLLDEPNAIRSAISKMSIA